jgi:hypothetical protein
VRELLFGFRCLPRRTRPLFQRGGCPEEPDLYFNEGVASGSRPVLFDRLAFLPRRTSYLPLPLSGHCLYLVLSSRFVSSLQCLVWIRLCLRQVAVLSRLFATFCLVQSRLFCLRQTVILPSSGLRFVSSLCLVILSCRFVLSRFVSSFCLVVLSRRFSVSLFGFSVAFVRLSFCPHWAVGSRYFRSRYYFVTWIASSSLSSLSSHPPTPHDYNPTEGGRGGG